MSNPYRIQAMTPPKSEVELLREENQELRKELKAFTSLSTKLLALLDKKFGRLPYFSELPELLQLSKLQRK